MRILLVRTSALGDVVHALPVLTALRRSRPDARLGWVIEARFAPLLQGHADLDDILEVDLRGWRKRPFARSTRSALATAIRRLRAFQPDVALDLMGNHKGALLARLSGAPITIGARRQDRREPSSAWWIKRPVALAGTHAAARTLSLLSALGLAAETPNGSGPSHTEPPLDFGPTKLLPDVPAAARDWLARRSRPFVFIHPGAAWGNKRYPAEGWGAVARALRDALAWDVVVGAGPGEDALAREIAAASGGAAEIVAAPTLPALGAILRRAGIVLGGDTGPLHLARALGVPAVFVMGPTDPERHGPYGEPASALHVALPCSGCYKRFDSAKACLLAISPAAIVARALALMPAAPGPRS